MPEINAISPERMLWEEILPAGAHWSGILKRGTSLRLTDLQGGANCSALFYNAEEKLERYNMADTLKAQHTAKLTRGHVCYSDMGRVLCSITADSLGWHDPIGGVSNAELVRARHGEAPYQTHHNAMHRNGYDSLLIEAGKWGLGTRDLVANINFFSKVTVDEAGNLAFQPGHSTPGDYIDLRFEMHTLVLLATAPHPLDPNPEYAPRPVQLTAWRSGPAPIDDICRNACPENQRGFYNTEILFRQEA